MLALDGGGVRGVVTLRLLVALERELGARVATRVRVIAGSSVGALIACALALGMAPGEILALLRSLARLVFDPGPLGGLEVIAGPRYEDEALERELRHVFGDRVLAELSSPGVLVPVYDRTNRRALIAKTWRSEWAAWPIRTLLRAAMAAPTYFDPGPIPVGGFLLGGGRYESAEGLDGGLVANAPALCALAEGVALGHELEELRIVSIGTGEPDLPPARSARGRGALAWLPELVEAAIRGPAAAVDFQARALLGDRYARLQPALTIDADLDDARRIPELEAQAAAWLEGREGAAALAAGAELLAR